MAPNADQSISMDIRQKAGVSFAASLTFEDIHHSYYSEPVLCGIDLVVAPGEVLCLLGPSGSGKTTLLRLAAGIEVQSQGRLLLNGREIATPDKALPPEKRGIGLMFQDFALFPHMTILDNTKYGLTALSADEAEKQAVLSLRRVGLEPYQSVYPHVLSGGEQQRAALARAIAPRPSVLLMDEPFSGLDSRLKEVVRSDTLSILREARATSLIVTHDADEAMQMADRIALLKDGRLVQVGTGRDLYQNPVDLFTASFFSDLNVLPAIAKSGRAETCLGVVDATGFSDGTKLDVAIRHSGVMVDINVDDTGAGGMPARIITRRFIGRLEQLQLAVSDTDNLIHASIRAGKLPPSVSDVFLKINDQDVFLFETSL